MEEGQIVILSLQQQDGKLKERPALLLRKLPYADDWLVCGISSKIFRKIQGFDILIDDTHPDFKRSHLISSGLIRLGFISSISERQVKGRLGDVSPETRQELIANLRKLLKGKNK